MLADVDVDRAVVGANTALDTPRAVRNHIRSNQYFLLPGFFSGKIKNSHFTDFFLWGDIPGTGRQCH
jgi:hypothetical protein